MTKRPALMVVSDGSNPAGMTNPDWALSFQFMPVSNREWKKYQDVAAYLINQMAEHFGLERAEGPQDIDGLRSGTEWEIDARGVRSGDGGAVIIECRRHTTSGIKQEEVAGLAYRIRDTGAVGGFIVSPLGLQEGAEMVAQAENIVSVKLAANSTTTNYVMEFLYEILVGVADGGVVGDRAVVAVLRDVITGKQQRFESS